MKRTRTLVAALILVGATLIAYLPALRGGFVWDDDSYVTANETLRTASGLADIWLDPGATPQYYPLTHTAFWIEHRIWGVNPLGYHVVNVLLHALSAILLAILLETLGVPGAWLAAAVFALHPVHVESVAWVTERKNTLSGVLALAAALGYVRAGLSERPRGFGARDLGLVYVLFVGALLAKTVVATLPVALALLVWWKRGALRRSDVFRLAPMLAVGALFGAATAWLETHHVGASGEEWSLAPAARLLLAGRAPWFYLGKLLWPSPLIFIYPRWELDTASVAAWCFPVATVGAVALLWAMRRHWGSGPLVAWLYFLVALFPALGFFDVYPMRYSFVADHFQYLASLGPIALFAAGCAAASRSSRVAPRRALGGVLLVALGSVTFSRAHAYHDLETLWRDTLAKNPGAWMAHDNLGASLAKRGQLDEAIEQLREGVRLKPDHADARDLLGSALAKTGRYDEAVEQFREAVRIFPQSPEMLADLAEALVLSGKAQDALAVFERGTSLSPDDPRLNAGLGAALASLGRFDDAIPPLEKAIAKAPNDAKTRYNLGTLYFKKGRIGDAEVQLAEAVRIDPGFEKARKNLEAARKALAR